MAMPTPTDTATPAANAPAMPPQQGQADSAPNDPQARYAALQTRAEKLAAMSEAPILGFGAERTEFIRQYAGLNDMMMQDLQAKQTAAAKKQGMLGMIGYLVGGLLSAAARVVFFSRKKEGFWKRYALPGGAGVVGGFIGSAIGLKAASGSVQKQFSQDQVTVITANNEAVEKLCAEFEQKLSARVQQLTMADQQSVPPQASMPAAGLNDVVQPQSDAMSAEDFQSVFKRLQEKENQIEQQAAQLSERVKRLDTIMQDPRLGMESVRKQFNEDLAKSDAVSGQEQALLTQLTVKLMAAKTEAEKLVNTQDMNSEQKQAQMASLARETENVIENIQRVASQHIPAASHVCDGYELQIQARMKQLGMSGTPVPAQPVAPLSGMLSDAMADQSHRQGAAVGSPA